MTRIRRIAVAIGEGVPPLTSVPFLIRSSGIADDSCPNEICSFDGGHEKRSQTFLAGSLFSVHRVVRLPAQERPAVSRQFLTVRSALFQLVRARSFRQEQENASHVSPKPFGASVSRRPNEIMIAHQFGFVCRAPWLALVLAKLNIASDAVDKTRGRCEILVSLMSSVR